LAEKEITLEIKNPGIIVLIVFLAIVFVRELQVTLSTPISFGDEGFHTRMAQWIAQNREYPVWEPLTETPSSRNSFFRPPVWNLLEASFIYIFGFNELIIKLLTPMISVLTGFLVYFLAKHFYNNRIGLMSGAILVTLPSFVTYSVLFYSDALTTFYTTLFIFMFLLSMKTRRKLHMLAAGAYGMFVFMTKYTGNMIYVFVVCVFLYYFFTEKKFFSLIKRYWPMVLMMILIPSTYFIRNYVYYGTPICQKPPFSGFLFDRVFDLSRCSVYTFEEQYGFGGRTEKAGTEQNVLSIGLLNYLEFAYGNIWFVIFAFFSGIFLIFIKSVGGLEEFHIKGISTTDTIFLLFLVLYIFPTFFVTMTRAEDTARYALMWAPVISVIAARYFDEVYNFLKRYQRHLALVVFIFVLYFCYINASSKLAVMAQVKQFQPSFFEACDWGKQNMPSDSIMATVWTYRTIYSCQRSAVGISADMVVSNNVSHILSTANELGITHIFIQKFSIDYQNMHYSERYDVDFVKLLEDNSEHFVKIFENGPGLDVCLQQGGCDGNIIYEIKY